MMAGMGQLGKTTSLQSLRDRARQRRMARRARRNERRSMRSRHAAERRQRQGKTLAQRIQEARRRRTERQLKQIESVAALLRDRKQRSYDITMGSSGSRARITSLVKDAFERRRLNREVPCPSGDLKNMIFGFPGTGIVVARPAVTATEAVARAADNLQKQQGAKAMHLRRMSKLRCKEEATKAATEASKDPVIVKNDAPVGGKTETEQEMEKIEEVTRQAEETMIISDEKEEQVTEIETVLEDAKDQLEEEKAQLADEKDLTSELKNLQQQIDELTGTLVDARIEYEESLFGAAETNQTQVTMMQAEIERLKAIISVQPELEPVLEPYVEAYQDDIVIAQEDIEDAEAAIDDAQADMAETAAEAAKTAGDILETKPFHVRHRNGLLVGGAVAIVVGIWWWRKRDAEQTLMRNDGYYNLPEPKIPRRPSGL